MSEVGPRQKTRNPPGCAVPDPRESVRGVAGLVAQKRKPKRETLQERSDRARLYGRLYLAQMGAHNRGDALECETLEMAMNEIKRLRIETGYYGSERNHGPSEKGPIPVEQCGAGRSDEAATC